MSEPKGPERARRLGDFEILRELGRGGMGIVYEARQVSLNRRVALKVLSSGLGLSSKAVVRFRREAEAAAKLHHTNIVPIYATGEEDGTHFYAMELIEGPSLNIVIREMRRAGMAARDHAESEPEARARDAECDVPKRQCGHEERLEADAQESTATDTTSTLPQSLMETLTDGAVSAGASSAASEGSTTLTTGGGYFDTIARMIAEVADALDYAHDQGVIHRDIKPSNLLLSPAGRLSVNDFGLARMLEQPGMTTTGEFMGSPLYMSPEQITAGRAPLDHRTDIYSLGASLYELLTLQPPFPGERRDQVIAQIIHKEPRPLRRLNKKVPVDLETICLKALDKDPDRRYQTAGQMAEDLRRFVNRFAISAKRAGPIARAVKWVRRRPAVAVLLLLAVLAGTAAGLLAYRVHVSKQQMVALQRQNALDDALLAAMSGDFAAAEEAIKQAELLGASAGRIRMLRGQVALHQGNAREAVGHLEQAVRLLPESVSARALLARACTEDGQIGRWYAMLEDLERLTPETHEDYLFKGLAEVWVHPRQALNSLDEAIRRHDSAVGRLIRTQARIWRATDTANPNDVELALEDAARAKGLLPDNPVAQNWHLRAQLVAAHVYAQTHQEEKRAACLVEAERDAEALESFAGLWTAHEARARYFEFVGQDDAALTEWRRGIEAPQASTMVVRSYAAALYRRGAFEEALRVLDRFATPGEDASSEAHRLFVLAELPDGLARVLAAIEHSAPLRLRGLDWLYHSQALRLLGRRSQAAAASRATRERIVPTSTWMQEWYQHLLDYDCGDLSTQELLVRAGSSRWYQCEAHFAIGLNLLAEGDRAGAAEHFRKCVDTYVFEYFEYKWSRAFLTRLEQDPTWPPWIPLKGAAATQPASAPVDGNVGKEEP